MGQLDYLPGLDENLDHGKTIQDIQNSTRLNLSFLQKQQTKADTLSPESLREQQESRKYRALIRAELDKTKRSSLSWKDEGVVSINDKEFVFPIDYFAQIIEDRIILNMKQPIMEVNNGSVIHRGYYSKFHTLLAEPDESGRSILSHEDVTDPQGNIVKRPLPIYNIEMVGKDMTIEKIVENLRMKMRKRT